MTYVWQMILDFISKKCVSKRNLLKQMSETTSIELGYFRYYHFWEWENLFVRTFEMSCLMHNELCVVSVEHVYLNGWYFYKIVFLDWRSFSILILNWIFESLIRITNIGHRHDKSQFFIQRNANGPLEHYGKYVVQSLSFPVCLFKFHPNQFLCNPRDTLQSNWSWVCNSQSICIASTICMCHVFKRAWWTSSLVLENDSTLRIWKS